MRTVNYQVGDLVVLTDYSKDRFRDQINSKYHRELGTCGTVTRIRGDMVDIKELDSGHKYSCFNWRMEKCKMMTAKDHIFVYGAKCPK